MGESLDIEQPKALLGYLRQEGRIGRQETPRVQALSGGVSNRAVLVERSNGEAWVLKQALAKLRVEVDWFSPPERVHREALGLRWLAEIAPAGTITPLVFEDFEHHLIAIEAVPQPHANWKAMLLFGDLRSEHVRQYAVLLGTVHRESAARRNELEPLFGDRGYFESLRLEPYYAYTATQVELAAPFIASLIADCRATRESLVHGDYSPKNVLVRNDQLILLDHEVIHFGDPGFDLGFSMTHMLSKAHHLSEQRSQFRDAVDEYWRTYCKTVNDVSRIELLEPRAVRHTLGCLLGRVRGRSKLEYLDIKERERQERVVVNLMRDPPQRVSELAMRFCGDITELER